MHGVARAPGLGELAMNVHEDTIAQALGFCMQSRTCPLIAFIWDCFSTHLDLENKVPSSQAETWSCSATAQI